MKVQPTESYIGQASYMYDRSREKIWTNGLAVNGARTLTLHEWLEVVLHEMIHILDYETNPNHFLGYMRHAYDAHGYWFMNEGEKYTKYGFHVQRYCNADIGLNTDDSKVKNRIDNSVFLFMKGNDQRPMIMKMSRKNLDWNLENIIYRLGNGRSFGNGVKQIHILTSNNPNIAVLRDLRMRDKNSRISWWWFTDEFQKKYGPFDTERTLDVLRAQSKSRVSEDDSDKPEEVEPETPEEVIDEIKDNVEGVSDVKEVGDDKFMVSIP